MFTFEDLLQVGESHIRELMAAIDKRTLALALKGTNEDLKNHFFRTMSSRAVEMLTEDVESLAPSEAGTLSKLRLKSSLTARQLEPKERLY